MKVTLDEYELPLAIADTVAELAEIVGTSRNTISSNITHQKSGVIKRGSYKKIDIGEPEEDEGQCLEQL